MSSLATRISCNFLKLRRLYIRHGYISSIKTLTGKCSDNALTFVGVGITSTPIFASTMVVKKQDVRENENTIYALDEIVKTCTEAAFKGHRCTHEKCSRIIEDYETKFDWSEVKLTPGEPVFEEIVITDQHKDERTYMVFETFYENNTSAVQQHTLKTIVNTSSSCVSSIEKGFQTNIQGGLSLNAPFKIANASVGFSKGFPVTGPNKEEERVMSWSVEDTLTVPVKTTIKASISITATQKEFKFHTWVAVQGKAKVIFSNGDIRHPISVPMSTIIFEEFPENMTKQENGIDYLKIEGTCKFTYAVSQKININ